MWSPQISSVAESRTAQGRPNDFLLIPAAACSPGVYGATRADQLQAHTSIALLVFTTGIPSHRLVSSPVIEYFSKIPNFDYNSVFPDGLSGP